MLGLYYIPIVLISHETGIAPEGASKALRSLKEAGFAAYDPDSEHVWVYEMARFQVAGHLKPNDNRVKNVRDAYNTLRNNMFLGDFFDKYADAFHLEKRRDNRGRAQAPSKPLRSQEQEQEQEKEEKELTASVDAESANAVGVAAVNGSDEPAAGGAGPLEAGVLLTKRKRRLAGWKLAGFWRFWEAFSLKQGRAEAADAWLDIPGLTPALVETVCVAAAREAAARPAEQRAGKRPKWAQGWLAGRRWEDEPMPTGGKFHGLASKDYWAGTDNAEPLDADDGGYRAPSEGRPAGHGGPAPTGQFAFGGH